MKNDLLKSAIADAKAVKDTAMANAKRTLEEAFRPQLQRMLSTKLQEELEDETEDTDQVENTEEVSDTDMENNDDEISVRNTVPITNAKKNGTEDVNIDEDDEDIEYNEPLEDENQEETENQELDEMLDLKSILAELDDDEDNETIEDNESDETTIYEIIDDETIDEIIDDETIDQNELSDLDEIEIIDDGTIENDGNENNSELSERVEELEDENENLKSDLNEHIKTVKYLKSKINEVNILNAKLLYTTKLFKSFNLNNKEKMKIVESFDRTSNIREIKLVFSTFAESLKIGDVKVNRNNGRILEGISSKFVTSTKPSKEIITESNELALRFQKLANIKQTLNG